MKRYFIFGLLLLSVVLVLGGCEKKKKELGAEEALGILAGKPSGQLTRTIQNIKAGQRPKHLLLK